MRNCEFNVFMELLKSDEDTALTMGWVMLNLTEKQLVKVIDFYKEKGECNIIENSKGIKIYQFARAWQYPVSEYDKVKYVEMWDRIGRKLSKII